MDDFTSGLITGSIITGTAIAIFVLSKSNPGPKPPGPGPKPPGMLRPMTEGTTKNGGVNPPPTCSRPPLGPEGPGRQPSPTINLRILK